MNKQEILEFIRKNPACSLATCDGNQPRVRGMLTYRADETGILFHTGRPKDLYKELVANPNVEVCYIEVGTSTQVRVTGRVTILEDLDLKKQIVKDRPFLKPVAEQFGYESLVVLRLAPEEAVVWTFATNFEPKQRIKLSS